MSPSTTSATTRVLLLLAAACAVAAGWLAFDRPVVADTGGGGAVTCAAPWDTAWHGEDPNAPGGDLGAVVGGTTNDCYEAGAARFQLAVVAASGAFFLGVGAGRSGRGARRGTASVPERQDRRTAIPG